MINQAHGATLWALVVVSLLAGTAANRAHAEQIPSDSPFGPDTITLDTETGLRWLDLTLSTPFTYDEMLVELGPGGTFDGYRLATRAGMIRDYLGFHGDPAWRSSQREGE